LRHFTWSDVSFYDMVVWMRPHPEGGKDLSVAMMTLLGLQPGAHAGGC